MTRRTQRTEAKRQYATHYTDHDLPSAMRLYQQVMASHPRDPEAEYSRVQIQNIVHAVVPKQKLLDAQMKLAAIHFDHRA